MSDDFSLRKEVRRNAIASVAWSEATDPIGASVLRSRFEGACSPMTENQLSQILPKEAVDILKQVAELRRQYQRLTRGQHADKTGSDAA